MEVTTKYHQHLQFDLVCPQEICRPLLFTAHLFLMVTMTAFYYELYILGTLVTCMYVTSLLHWRYPKKKSYFRYIDIFAVCSCFTYSSYVALLYTTEIVIIWSSVVLMVIIAYSGNSVLNYYQIDKPNTIIMEMFKEVPSYKYVPENTHFSQKNLFKRIFHLQPTYPETDDRHFAFRRSICIHMICVHVIPTFLAISLLIKGNFDIKNQQ
jgi:hypothetical protein